MIPRYSFSSRRTRHIDKITKQRPKFPDLLERLIEEADILLEVLDSRFLKETRNFGVERRIKSLGKKLILVNNKCDLVFKNPSGINVSCLSRRGIKELREIIKIKSWKSKNRNYWLSEYRKEFFNKFFSRKKFGRNRKRSWFHEGLTKTSIVQGHFFNRQPRSDSTKRIFLFGFKKIRRLCENWNSILSSSEKSRDGSRKNL